MLAIMETPRHWMRLYGDSMDQFRARVAARLAGEAPEPTPTPEPIPPVDFTPYRARINTRYDAGQALWNNTQRGARVVQVPKGEIVTVLGAPQNGFVLAEYQGKKGYADNQYLVKVADVPPTPKPEPPKEFIPYLAKINTRYDAGLSLWSTPQKGARVIQIPKGRVIVVIGEPVGGFVPAEYQGAKGYADNQYLVKMNDLPPDPKPEPKPEPTPPTFVPYRAKINTKNAAGMSLWNNSKKSSRVYGPIAKGQYLTVLSLPVDGFVRAQYNGVTGQADNQYLIAEEPAGPA